MINDTIIGRASEKKTLKKLYDSKRSEFVAVYGRRRVGKTFLLKELFGETYSFYMTGLSITNLKGQLLNFYTALGKFDTTLQEKLIPNNWFEAFQLLINYLENSTAKRKVVFIDELPWLDTPRSDFISSLEYFWNSWAYHRKDILLIVCGSATSWMINELINNHGGLHNRVTTRIHLQPFTLGEMETFLRAKGAVYDRYQLVQLYMAMGGIPFYLDEVDVKQSIAQNIDRLFFSQGGLLRTEFSNLYRSLFKKQERHIAIIEALATKSKGLSRKDLVKFAKLPNGGSTTNILEELAQCGFIHQYLPFGKKKRTALYQLTDPYSLFYLKFIKNSKSAGEGAWLRQMDLPQWQAWSGYAFEAICRYHLPQIKKELGIKGVYTEVSSWQSSKAKDGAQIDLVMDRRDRVINLFEIKFSQNIYTIKKAYAQNLRNKMTTFRTETKTTKALFLTFITTFGLKNNQYSIGLVQNELTMDALFD